MIGEVEDENI
ncbi:Hypothetical protein SSCIU_02451 [Mammaliicoccus sciuri]|nr:Hypothetical protein SSCIU_02451 [Mammaliicoccus sciuri]